MTLTDLDFKLQVELQDCERGREADLADRARARLPRGALLQQRLQPHVDRRPPEAPKLQGSRGKRGSCFIHQVVFSRRVYNKS